MNEPAMNGAREALHVGAELKQARESLGLDLGEVAQQLKFAARQLEALEEGRFGELPGGTFARGMVRSYARLLRIDAEPLIARLAGRFGVPDASGLVARYSQPVPFSDNARRSTMTYLAVSIGVLAIGAGFAYEWYREHRSPPSVAKRSPPEKARVAAASRPESSRPEAPQPAPPKTQPKATEMHAPETAKVAAPANPEAARDKMAVAKVASVPVASVPSGVHRLVIQCDEEAWIEVKDANERMLVSSLNPAGAERVVRARGPLALVIGNADHVRVLHNDKPLDLQPHTKGAIARFTLP